MQQCPQQLARTQTRKGFSGRRRDRRQCTAAKQAAGRSSALLWVLSPPQTGPPHPHRCGLRPPLLAPVTSAQMCPQDPRFPGRFWDGGVPVPSGPGSSLVLLPEGESWPASSPEAGGTGLPHCPPAGPCPVHAPAGGGTADKGHPRSLASCACPTICACLMS